MFSDFTTRELAIIALLLEEEQRAERRKVAKRVVERKERPERTVEDRERPICKIAAVYRKRRPPRIYKRNRKQLGEFWTLFPQLVDAEERFFQYFKMSQRQFDALLANVGEAIAKDKTIIGPQEKLAMCLRFLVSGESYKVIAEKFCMGLSTVAIMVIEVCRAIVDCVGPACMPAPNRERWLSVAREFRDHRRFPNCVGILEGRTVTIVSPSINVTPNMIDHKGAYSMVIIALIDARAKFIAVDVGMYDDGMGEIFDNSELGKKLALKKLDLPEDEELPNTDRIAPYVLLGNSAFHSKRHLLRPFGPNDRCPAKKRFNGRLKRARSSSDVAFASLSQRFNFFNTEIKLLPKNLDKVILAACVLHNFIDSDLTYDIQRPRKKSNFLNLTATKGSCSKAARDSRDIFKSYFYELENS